MRLRCRTRPVNSELSFEGSTSLLPKGVTINDKHIETIVRCMLRRVRIKEVGDSTFLVDEHVDKREFERENEKVIARGGKPAVAEACIAGRVDHLRGLKENVIMGRLIPAGTGLPAYKRLDVMVEDAVGMNSESSDRPIAAAANEES